jgi:class 3 adenylate cyclase
LLPVRIAEFAFINVYGTDVTARRAMNKFPDQNPNPVLRVSQDGRLVYANAAAAPIHRAFGAQVGEALAPEWFARIRERLESDADDVLEVVSEGRIFAVLVKNVYEFNFINLHGTDITAARMVEAANAENERLLLNILPAPIAARLRAGERVIADRFDDVTLLFADIVDFTTMSSEMSPAELVDILNDVFSLFDELVDRHRLEKIKTIGDAYMVVGGLTDDPEDHTARVAAMALDLTTAVARVKRRSGAAITIRIGMHRGPVVAGVIGTKKFIYDVWGDTVNVASRMESHGVPGRVQVTAAVVDRLQGAFDFEPRGAVEIKGKGRLQTWYLARRSPSAGGAALPGSRNNRPPA